MNSGREDGLPITPNLMTPLSQALKASDQRNRSTHSFSYSAMATIYELLGIDPHMTVPNRQGRPVHIAHGGDPVFDVIG